MNTADEKDKTLRQQVNAKVIWGAHDGEVLDWLEERHGITGTIAEELLNSALRAKCAAVRQKALVHLAVSIPGMLIASAWVLLQGSAGIIWVSYGSLLIIFLGFVSLGLFIRSLYRLLSGRTQGSVY